MENTDNVTPLVVSVLMALGAAIMSPALEVMLEKHQERRRLLGTIATVGVMMIAAAIPLSIRGVPSGARLAAVLKYWPFLIGGSVIGTAYYLVLCIVRHRWLIDEQARLSRAIETGVDAIRGDFTARLDALATRADLTSQGEELGRNVSHLVSQVAELRRNLAAADSRIDHLRQEAAEQKEYTAGLEARLATVPKRIQKAIARFGSELVAGLDDGYETLDKEAKNRIERVPPMELTAGQLHDEIQAIEWSVRREYSKRYLGAYIRWDCWVIAREHKGNMIRLNFRVSPILTRETVLTQDPRHALMLVTTKLRVTPALALLKENEAVTLTGRIYGINAVSGFGVRIDDAEIKLRPQ